MYCYFVTFEKISCEKHYYIGIILRFSCTLLLRVLEYTIYWYLFLGISRTFPFTEAHLERRFLLLIVIRGFVVNDHICSLCPQPSLSTVVFKGVQ
jgi:hypothetical protein